MPQSRPVRIAILGGPPNPRDDPFPVPNYLRDRDLIVIPIIEVHGLSKAGFDPAATPDRSGVAMNTNPIQLGPPLDITEGRSKEQQSEAGAKSVECRWESWSASDNDEATKVLRAMDAVIVRTKPAWNIADMLMPVHDWLEPLESLSSGCDRNDMGEHDLREICPTFFCHQPHTQEEYDALQRFKTQVTACGLDYFEAGHMSGCGAYYHLAVKIARELFSRDHAHRQDTLRVVHFLREHLGESQREAGTNSNTAISRPITGNASAPTPTAATPGLSLLGKTPAIDDIRTPPISQNEQLQSSRAFDRLTAKRDPPPPPPVPQKSALRPPIDIAPSRSVSSRGVRRADVPSVPGSARSRDKGKGKATEGHSSSSTAPHFPIISPPVSGVDVPPVPPPKDDHSDALSPFKNPRRAPMPPGQLHTLPMPNLDPLMSAQNSPAVPSKQDQVKQATPNAREILAEADEGNKQKQEKRRTPTTGWWTPKPKADTWKPKRRSMDLFRRKQPEDRMVEPQQGTRGRIERDEVALDEQDIIDALDDPELMQIAGNDLPIMSPSATTSTDPSVTPQANTGYQPQSSTGGHSLTSSKRDRSSEEIDAGIARLLDKMTKRVPSEYRGQARRPSSRNEEHMQDPFKSEPNLPLEPAQTRGHWRWSQNSNLSEVLNFGRGNAAEGDVGMADMARPVRRGSDQADLPETEEEYSGAGDGSADAVMGQEDQGERRKDEEKPEEDGAKQGRSKAWAAHVRGSFQLVRSAEATNETSPESYENPFVFDGTVDLHSPSTVGDAQRDDRDSGYAPSTHSDDVGQEGQAADASSAGLPASPDAPVTQSHTPPGPPRIRRPATPESEDSGYLAANAGETPFTRSRRVLHPDYDESAPETSPTLLSPERVPTVREVAPFLSLQGSSGPSAVAPTYPPAQRAGNAVTTNTTGQVGGSHGLVSAVPSHLQPMDRPNWFVRTIRDLPFLARFKRSSFRMIREQVPHFPATSTFAATRGVAPPGGTVDSIWAQGATRIEGAPLPVPGVVSPPPVARSPTLERAESTPLMRSPDHPSPVAVRASPAKGKGSVVDQSPVTGHGDGTAQMQATSPMQTTSPSPQQTTSPKQAASPIAGPSGTRSHSQTGSAIDLAQLVPIKPTSRAFKRVSSYSSTAERGSPVPRHVSPRDSAEADLDPSSALDTSTRSKVKGKEKELAPEIKIGKLRPGADPALVRARKEAEARADAEARENWKNSTLCGLWWSQT